ncbi:MAG: oligosaccharide flippase family protein [Candidatus Sericytochromatia bacterium]|nr:oligosaccharide flippase family protein [Candidatus Sericytochromatia bacterium]
MLTRQGTLWPRLLQQGFVRQLSWKTLSEVLSRLLGLLFFVLLARVLGDSGLGEYTLPLALAGLLALLLDWGSNSLLLREVAREPDRAGHWLSMALALKGLAALSFVLALWLWPWLLPLQITASRLLAAGGLLLGQAGMDTLVAWLNARGAYRLELQLRLGSRLGVLALQLLLLGYWPAIDVLLWGAALGQLLALAVCLGVIWRVDPVRLSWPAARPLWQFFCAGWTFWLANMAWLLYLKMDLAMLPLLGRPAEELGWYQSAVRFYEIPGLGAWLISVVALPRLSAKAAASSSGGADFKQAVDRGMRWLSPLSLLLALLAFGLGPLLIEALLGADYAPAARSFALLSLGLPGIFVSLFWFSVLGAAQRQRLVAWGTACCLALNLLLNSLWIPRWGQQGAALSTLCCDLLLWGFFMACGIRLNLLQTRWQLVIWPLWCALSAGLLLSGFSWAVG